MGDEVKVPLKRCCGRHGVIACWEKKRKQNPLGAVTTQGQLIPHHSFNRSGSIGPLTPLYEKEVNVHNSFVITPSKEETQCPCNGLDEHIQLHEPLAFAYLRGQKANKWQQDQQKGMSPPKVLNRRLQNRWRYCSDSWGKTVWQKKITCLDNRAVCCPSAHPWLEAHWCPRHCCLENRHDQIDLIFASEIQYGKFLWQKDSDVSVKLEFTQQMWFKKSWAQHFMLELSYLSECS